MMIAFLVVGFMGLIYLLHFVDEKLKPVYLDPIEDDLAELATLLSSAVSLGSSGSELQFDQVDAILKHAMARRLNARIYDRLKTNIDLHVYVTDNRGLVVYDSENETLMGQDYSSWNDVKRTLLGEYGARATWTAEETPRLFIYVASPVRVGGQTLGVVSVGKPTPSVAFSVFQKMRQEAFFGVYVAAMLGIALAVLFTIWVTNPIARLTDYAGAIRDGKPVALPNLGKSDIGELGRSFDQMRDALEGKNYVEQYVQTLTHEIKSPLSAIKGAAELLDEPMPDTRRARFIGNIQTETQRIQLIVDRLLELSALESRKSLRHIRPVQLGDVIGEILISAGPLLEAKVLELQFDEEPGLVIEAERFLIHLALSNLINNAIHFAPKKGKIRIYFRDASVFIADNGPGVPAYAVDRVFERFYSLRRPDSGRKSSGLGLSIVKRVAELHGAEVFLRNLPQGGAEAELKFKPVADPATKG